MKRINTIVTLLLVSIPIVAFAKEAKDWNMDRVNKGGVLSDQVETGYPMSMLDAWQKGSIQYYKDYVQWEQDNLSLSERKF